MRHPSSVVSARTLAITLATLLALVATSARAAEIIPSVGLTRTIDGGNDTRTFGGLALRAPIVPMLAGEIGVAYRSESRFDDQLDVRMWPVTASLWVTPVPTVYAGAGVGWYNVTLDYDDALPIEDETRQEFGVHVGGGMRIPVAPSATVDLNGRYVMMRDQESRLVPETFDPDFWQLSLGLGIRF